MVHNICIAQMPHMKSIVIEITSEFKLSCTKLKLVNERVALVKDGARIDGRSPRYRPAILWIFWLFRNAKDIELSRTTRVCQFPMPARIALANKPNRKRIPNNSVIAGAEMPLREFVIIVNDTNMVSRALPDGKIVVCVYAIFRPRNISVAERLNHSPVLG